MPELFQNQYRIKSARLEGYDYTQPAWYFITICTKGHKEYFGKIVDNEIVLNKTGSIALKCWKEIPAHFPNTDIDSHILMPNHIHGIVIINYRRDAACCVSTPATGSLSAIVRSYKSAVSNIVRKNINPHFQWQTRFYDRIIRNEKELYRIRKYIEQNPLKWELEKNNPGNIIT